MTTLAIRVPALRVKEVDGAPDVLGVETITVSNGSLTDDGAGAVTLVTGAAASSLTVTEEDNNPSVANVSEIRVTNGTLTDNGGGSVSIAIGGGSLEVKEIDGAPDVSGVSIVQVSNGTLTDNGGGNVTINTSAAAALVSGKVTRVAGDLSDATHGFVDATSMSITLTTGARRCLVSFSGTGYTSTTAVLSVDLNIDGAAVGGSLGTVVVSSNNTNQNVSFTHLTDVLTAAAHTFKIQYKSDAGTANLRASGTTPLILSVVELYT